MPLLNTRRQARPGAIITPKSQMRVPASQKRGREAEEEDRSGESSADEFALTENPAPEWDDSNCPRFVERLRSKVEEMMSRLSREAESGVQSGRKKRTKKRSKKRRVVEPSLQVGEEADVEEDMGGNDCMEDTGGFAEDVSANGCQSTPAPTSSTPTSPSAHDLAPQDVPTASTSASPPQTVPEPLESARTPPPDPIPARPAQPPQRRAAQKATSLFKPQAKYDRQTAKMMPGVKFGEEEQEAVDLEEGRSHELMTSDSSEPESEASNAPPTPRKRPKKAKASKRASKSSRKRSSSQPSNTNYNAPLPSSPLCEDYFRTVPPPNFPQADIDILRVRFDEIYLYIEKRSDTAQFFKVLLYGYMENRDAAWKLQRRTQMFNVFCEGLSPDAVALLIRDRPPSKEELKALSRRNFVVGVYLALLDREQEAITTERPKRVHVYCGSGAAAPTRRGGKVFGIDRRIKENHEPNLQPHKTKPSTLFYNIGRLRPKSDLTWVTIWELPFDYNTATPLDVNHAKLASQFAEFLLHYWLPTFQTHHPTSFWATTEIHGLNSASPLKTVSPLTGKDVPFPFDEETLSANKKAGRKRRNDSKTILDWSKNTVKGQAYVAKKIAEAKNKRRAPVLKELAKIGISEIPSHWIKKGVLNPHWRSLVIALKK